MTSNPKNLAQNYQSGPDTSTDPKLKRDPENRPASDDERARREKSLDQTIADTFPTSDPPSTIPNPGEDEEDAA
jgi:hypothetical protein